MRFCYLWIFLDLILNHETYFPDLKWWRNPSGFRRKSCGLGWRGLTWKINWLIYNKSCSLGWRGLTWKINSLVSNKSCGLGWRGLTWKNNWLIYNDIPNGIKQNERLSTVIFFVIILTQLKNRYVNVHSPQKNVLYILSVAQHPNAGQNIPQKCVQIFLSVLISRNTNILFFKFYKDFFWNKNYSI